ncbi:MAG: C4-dicarboxylate ABC transporter permease [Campylobacteraceae bacterium 4484_166]|nr:MAG: C4-dicarboxylate ABC transporter permease [Campylobacteraceae bacterium 4484_166]
MTIISKIIGFVNQSIAAFGISAGVAVAFVNVIVRYVFDDSLTWASELTIYLFLWSTFFGAAYCFKQDAHISINIILEKVKPKTAKFLLILSHTITVVFLGAVAYYGYEYLFLVHNLDEISVELDIPMWIIYLVIPISFSFATYRVLEKLYEISKTPADKVVQHSEAQMIIEQMTEGENEKLLKEIERKTAGML